MLCLARAHVPTAPSFARRASSSRAPSASRAEQQSRAQSSGSSTNANNNTVTYYNLLDRVADKHPELSKAQLKRVVDSTVAALRDSVAEGYNVSIKKFGTFKFRENPARRVKVPNSDNDVRDVPASRTPTFKASDWFKNYVAEKGTSQSTDQ